MISEEEKRKRASLEAVGDRARAIQARRTERDNQSPSADFDALAAPCFELPTPKAPRNPEEVAAEIDAVAEKQTVLEAEWKAAASKWGIALTATDFDNSESDHPFAIAFWNGEGPQGWKRDTARHLHKKWKRKDKLRQRDGVEEEQTFEILEGLIPLKEVIAKQKKADAVHDAFVFYASAVVNSWIERGAKIKGLRMKDGLLGQNSKAVKWFKTKTERQYAKRTAKRMVEKQRWETDFADYQAFR